MTIYLYLNVSETKEITLILGRAEITPKLFGSNGKSFKIHMYKYLGVIYIYIFDYKLC